ncbi:MAG: hypothetical protein ACXVCV_03685 [Polyangia bacterium]
MRPFVLLFALVAACAAEKTEMVACPPEGCQKIDPEPDNDPVRRRATFDLQCAREKIEMVEIDSTTRGARGCGRQATYKQRLPTYDWVMDSAVVTTPAPATP